MIGTLLKGYQILEKVKEGSVGTIYKAVHSSSNNPVALKQLARKHSIETRKLRAFRREATLARELNHRYIIKVYDYFEVEPQPFFTMEYFESENLKHCLWFRTEWIYKQEFHILRQVAEALSYLHSLGIVHKDMKPENILINKEREVRLIDFSLAQTRWQRFFQFGKRVEGTPLYMSPEQIQGKQVDPRSDIYSFGLLIFELLTKRPPFLGNSEMEVYQKHLNEPVPSMRLFVDTVFPELDECVRKMLSKNPRDRFSDMTTVLYEMGKWEKQDTQVRIRQVQPGKSPLQGR